MAFPPEAFVIGVMVAGTACLACLFDRADWTVDGQGPKASRVSLHSAVPLG